MRVNTLEEDHCEADGLHEHFEVLPIGLLVIYVMSNGTKTIRLLAKGLASMTYYFLNVSSPSPHLVFCWPQFRM